MEKEKTTSEIQDNTKNKELQNNTLYYLQYTSFFIKNMGEKSLYCDTIKSRIVSKKIYIENGNTHGYYESFM
ncbi:hypothetical protein [Fusobacterium sp.]|uniref:hypothetical protein n=1 Tax=Fusobacterium sp. TaxID=68766 RepID=UPI00396C309F